MYHVADPVYRDVAQTFVQCIYIYSCMGGLSGGHRGDLGVV